MNKQTIISVTIGIVAAAALVGVVMKRSDKPVSPDRASTNAANQASEGKVKAGAVPVELFVMSQCPYGVQAMNQLTPALQKLGGDVDFSLQFIGQIDGQGNLSSMHGDKEVTGDIAQLCAKKHAPAKYLDIIACQNKNMSEVATNWEACATEEKAPVTAIKKCIEGDEGKQLLTASFKRAEAANATGSPTFMIAGKPYEGRRSTDAILRAICAEHKAKPAPAACAALPELPVVNVTVLYDKRCSDCEQDNLAAAVKARIANPKITMVDYTEPAGKTLYEQLEGDKLPMLVFDDSLDKDNESKQAIGPGTKTIGKFRKLNVGGSWNPKCADQGGCELDECKNNLTCRPETPNTLELFVMSQCPYGVMALNAMPEVIKNFGDALNFHVHYIANGTATGGFQALHGQPEVDENIRQLCAAKHYGASKKYMDYILCRNKNIRSEEWKSCTGQNGIATEKIESCVKSDGPKLHEKDITIANSMGIGASPSWIVNGRYKFSGIDAETIRENLCKHNKDLKGCENKLSGAPQRGSAPTGGGCGG